MWGRIAAFFSTTRTEPLLSSEVSGVSQNPSDSPQSKSGGGSEMRDEGEGTPKDRKAGTRWTDTLPVGEPLTAQDFIYCSGVRCDRVGLCARWTGHLDPTKLGKRTINVASYADHRGRCVKHIPQVFTCDQAQKYWQDQWSSCPVCGCMEKPEGLWVHKDPKEVIQ